MVIIYTLEGLLCARTHTHTHTHTISLHLATALHTNFISPGNSRISKCLSCFFTVIMLGYPKNSLGNPLASYVRQVTITAHEN